MKAVRSIEGLAVNPLFSKDAQREARANGQPYDTAEFITLPVGEEVEHPDAWRLCVLGKAYPIDEECRQKVLSYMSNEQRQQTVADIKLLREAAKSNQLGKKDQKMLEMMERAYAVDLGLTAKPVATPQPTADAEV